MQNKNDKSNFQINEVSSGELDLKIFFRFFFRNKKFIGLISFIFFIGACLYSFSLKKVWQGNFEIVIDTKKGFAEGKLLDNPIFTNISQFSRTNDLRTEIGILGSPSVLLPAFELVSEEYKKVNPKKPDLIFSEWKKEYLDINRQGKTNIVSIKYKDTNKNIIIPVLEKISKDYQLYSGKTRRRNFELAEMYLKEQVQKYKEKSSKSIKLAQNFALNQDLSNVFIDNDNPKSLLESNLGIEQVRIKSANQIRKLDLQIKKIIEIGDDFEQLLYFFSTIPVLVEEKLPLELKELEDKIINLKSKYTDNDRLVIRSTKERDILIQKTKKRAIGLLKARRIIEETNMKAASRPKDIILKYKELIREAARDERTLINVENQLTTINLEKARYTDPWNLITNPTLKKWAIAPSKKRIGLIGLILGFSLSSAYTFIKEKKSNLIYNKEDLERILDANVLESIKINDSEIENTYKKNLLKVLFKVDSKSSINFISLLDKKQSEINKFIDSIEIDNKYSILESLNKLDQNNIFYLLTSLEFISFNDIKLLNNKLKAENVELSGIILFHY